jgi:hypothetical protein
MNKKQLIFMWFGITAILCVALLTIVGAHRPQYANFAVWALLVGLVTSGLICTLRDEKPPEGKNIGIINLRRGFKRITFVLAIVAAVLCLIIVNPIVINRYDSEHGFLRWSQENFLEEYGDIFDKLVAEDRGTVAGTDINIQKFRQKYPQYDDISDTELLPRVQKKYSEEKAKIIKLEKGFWITLSKQKLFGLCVLAG